MIIASVSVSVTIIIVITIEATHLLLVGLLPLQHHYLHRLQLYRLAAASTISLTTPHRITITIIIVVAVDTVVELVVTHIVPVPVKATAILFRRHLLMSVVTAAAVVIILSTTAPTLPTM